VVRHQAIDVAGRNDQHAAQRATDDRLDARPAPGSAVRSEWRLLAAAHNLLKLHRHQLATA
jgi:hypothetical protein